MVRPVTDAVNPLASGEPPPDGPDATPQSPSCAVPPLPTGEPFSVMPETKEPAMSPVPDPFRADAFTLATTCPTVTSPPNSVTPFTSTAAFADARSLVDVAPVLAEMAPVDSTPAEKLPTYCTASGGAVMVAVEPPGECTPHALADAVGVALPAGAPAREADAPATTRHAHAAAAARNRCTAPHYGDGRKALPRPPPG